MKKIFSLLICLQSLTGSAQVLINLSMNPRPIASINTWSSRADIATLIATPGPQASVRNVKINTTILTADGATVAITDMQRAPVKTLNQGSATIFRTADIINLEVMQFNGTYNSTLNRTGKLPAGNYQLVVKLDSTDQPITVSNTQTKPFFLASTVLPVLIAPVNESTLPMPVAQTEITFRWSPVSPRPTEPVRYRVQVFEVLPGQKPMQALRANQPLLDKEVVNTAQYVWQPQLSFVDDQNKKFIWTIQSYNFQGEIITGDVPNGEGRSEAYTFIISKKLKTLKNEKDQQFSRIYCHFGSCINGLS